MYRVPEPTPADTLRVGASVDRERGGVNTAGAPCGRDRWCQPGDARI